MQSLHVVNRKQAYRPAELTNAEAAFLSIAGILGIVACLALPKAFGAAVLCLLVPPSIFIALVADRRRKHIAPENVEDANEATSRRVEAALARRTK